ncbi:alpha/beta fold hydrolase [Nocardioides sp.]|uniref:alpha/beta hydrolase n=1 Tax=Nocardioides sp. TaxID=35761 RepID=UPI002638AF21|nr:alpha/beta fold hydrolase [Nocardioides sp.]
MSTTPSTKHDELTFDSHGTTCAAWHWTGVGSALETDAGRPVVVMAHGLAGTVDSGLEPFAAALAGAGMDVLAFDYRGFGVSGGTHRQRVRVADQVEDYRAAVAAAQRLPGVDASRVVLWGVSLSGGHVLQVAVGRDDVAAVVSLTPLVDGLAAARLAMGQHKPSTLLRSSISGVRSRATGGGLTMPVVARPGEVGALTLEGCLEDYLSIAGPTWRNEVDADVALELGTRAPMKAAKQLRVPTLVQIADFDRSAPPQAAAKAAFKARAEVRHYPCDHFDVWPGKAWFDAASAHQVAFLTRVLG